MTTSSDADVLIVGSGVGGGASALRLASHGLRVTMIERGGELPREEDNWNPRAVFVDKKYTAEERWLDRNGRPFRPAAYYNVGGATKLFGCTMLRFRERDFEAVEHAEGVSPAWPIRYAELAGYYDIAEQLYHVQGTAGIDPSEPPRSRQFPFPGITNEPALQAIVDRLASQGLHPFPQPSAIRMPPAGNCIRCDTCDGYPCKIGAKADAQVSTVTPALATGRVTLLTHTLAQRLLVSEDGKTIDGLEVIRRDGSREILRASRYVLAAGAVNTAALLLRSACSAAPQGVANRSGVVGRHFMVHNNTALMAIGAHRNPTVFQKNVAVTDFYFGDDGFEFPLGTILSLGKFKPGMLVAANRWTPNIVNAWLCAHSFDWWVMSEDLPDPDNRVTLEGSAIKLNVRRNNMRCHRELVKRTKRALQRAGLPIVLGQLMPFSSPSHQCGTVRFGSDPASAALDPFGRAFDHQNLFVVDASFFPSSAAVNPALTIAAQSLRVADHIARTDFGITTEASSVPSAVPIASAGFAGAPPGVA